jgi:hypothetical protein
MYFADEDENWASPGHTKSKYTEGAGSPTGWGGKFSANAVCAVMHSGLIQPTLVFASQLKANSVVGVMDVMGVIKVALAAVVTRLRANLMGGRLDGRQVMMTTTVLALKVWITLRRSEARRKMVGIACDEAIVKGRKRKKW